MASLGSIETPIQGESFGLPSGWSIKENVDGEVIIVDSGDNTIFRRDETNGEWVTDSINANAINASDVIGNAVYPTPSDIPADLEQAGNMVVTESDGLVVFVP